MPKHIDRNIAERYQEQQQAKKEKADKVKKLRKAKQKADRLRGERKP